MLNQQFSDIPSVNMCQNLYENVLYLCKYDMWKVLLQICYFEITLFKTALENENVFVFVFVFFLNHSAI